MPFGPVDLQMDQIHLSTRTPTTNFRSTIYSFNPPRGLFYGPPVHDGQRILLLTQWTEPGDIFSILLILGRDVIQLALTALTGHIITPVAFSFGWVAYAISALLSAIGENRLIQCPPEMPLLAINLKSGYARANQSWLLARLLKTYKY